MPSAPNLPGDPLDPTQYDWSAARTGALMVRQEEQPWRAQTTVLLDLRAAELGRAVQPDALAGELGRQVLERRVPERPHAREPPRQGVDTGLAVGASIVVGVKESVTYETAPKGIGCLYYESALREMLKLLVNGGGMIDHVHCRERGEDICEWRAEWRAVKGSQ